MRTNKYINDFCVLGFLVLIVLVYLPYLLAYTNNFAYSSIRAADEMAYLRIITEELYQFEWSIEYFKKFHTFGYGQVWWAFMCLVLAPGYLIDSEKFMFVMARTASLGFYIASLWFIYLSLKKFIKNNADLFLFGFLLIFSSLMQITIIKSTLIYSETAYLFFISVAIFYLQKDAGNFGKYIFISVICFCASLSIKGTPVPVGIIYPTYALIHFRTFPWSALFFIKLFLACFASILILNPTLLNDELLAHFLGILSFYSSVSKNGWPELQYTYSLGASIQNFEEYYLNLKFLIFLPVFVMVASFIENNGRISFLFSSSKPDNGLPLLPLYLMPLCAVLMFALFYTWLPNHFAFAFLALFIPLATIANRHLLHISCEVTNQIKSPSIRKTAEILIIFFAVAFYVIPNASQIKTGIQILSNPAPIVPRVKAIETIDRGLRSLGLQPQYVGVAHELGMPRINNNKTNHWMLNELPSSLILKSDLLIFWNQDEKYRRLYVSENKQEPQAYDNFQKIISGKVISNQVKFNKIFDENGITFYQAETIREIIEKKQIGNYGIVKAFDNSTLPNDFWEYPNGDQTWITVNFMEKQKSITRYSFSTGEEPSKMPKKWRVYALTKEGSWVQIDERRNQTQWKIDEKRTFSVENLESYNSIKFDFLSGNNPLVIRIYEIDIE